MFEIKIIILIVAAIVNIVLGFWVFLQQPKNRVTIYFLILTIAITLWVSMEIMININKDFEKALPWIYGLYLSAAIIPIFLFLFAHSFVQKQLLDWWKIILLFGVFLSVINLFTLKDFVFLDLFIKQGNFSFIPGLGFYLYSTYMVGLVVMAIYILFRAYQRFSGIDKVQVKFILLGSLIPGALGIITDILLPLVGVFEFLWMGPVFTVIMVVFIVYAIIKHHLLDIKVITTEAVVVLLSFFLLVNAFIAGTRYDFLIRFSLFTAVSIIGLFLIRSVLKEVRAREEIQKLALQLEKANLELRQLDKTKSEFISIASHQLRTPLTVIKGYISMIQEGTFGNVPAEVTDALKKVYTSNERLIHLVNDLLDISRIERGKMEYEIKPVSAVTLLDGAVEELTPRAKEAGLAFELKLPPEGLPQITADGEKLHQVFVNIIDNAIKYTERGSVVVSAEPQGKNVVFKFQDTGMGLTEEDLSHLFLRFVRGHRTSRLHANGTGLGLYVAKKIVDAHHGRVWAESEGKGKGSAFYVSLPVASGKTPKRG